MNVGIRSLVVIGVTGSLRRPLLKNAAQGRYSGRGLSRSNQSKLTSSVHRKFPRSRFATTSLLAKLSGAISQRGTRHKPNLTQRLRSLMRITSRRLSLPPLEVSRMRIGLSRAT